MPAAEPQPGTPAPPRSRSRAASRSRPVADAGRALATLLADEERAAIRRLVHVDDTHLDGWRRERRGDGFEVLDTRGRPVADDTALRRVRSLAIPPAWTDVWICPLADGHLQATGRDARGRKQYRYHPLWQQLRGATKFERLREFGLALPRIRRGVERDLGLPGLPARKVLATLVRLLDTTYLRVGNDEYARENRSFGLTTLRNRHAAVRGGHLKLSFRGKSGVQQTVELDDPRIARIVRKLQDLPGQDLFQCVDEDGELHGIGSGDVNAYLRELSGGDFTAKDFRTWHASALALERLQPCRADTKAEGQRLVKEVITEVASLLGHTVTVCRKSYVHPLVLASFGEGRLEQLCAREGRTPAAWRGLKPAERQLVTLLTPLRRRTTRSAAASGATAARLARRPRLTRCAAQPATVPGAGSSRRLASSVLCSGDTRAA
ncbi:DNA topoisomerase IB [Aquabacterium sp. J223]|uniref:DNA topoisomerase IB n=1 Tax=Aquabacterium sp. J223 TaxID=2898431 RepID=UPI0021AE2C11|nr:DNA topoisomerase IB [Aquabacterium sp. J223]UUX94270.1 DNA topoisomerase IB [Aquabacterium sp. J223]